VLAPNPHGVPVYLVNLLRWVLWREVKRTNRKTGKGETTKVPVGFRTGKNCDATNPLHWAAFADVTAAMERSTGAFDGYGIVLGDTGLGEWIIGADLDECLDEDEAIAPWALDPLTILHTYTDKSPGGRGLKPIARIRAAEVPEIRRLLGLAEHEFARTKILGEKVNGHHAPGMVLYLGKRFFTVTGRAWREAPEDVALLELGQIARLADWFGPKRTTDTTTPERGGDADETEPDEAAVREKLGVAFLRNPSLKARWDGSTAGLADTTRSARDMSIVAMLIGEGFTKAETRTALHLFEHGKIKQEDDRYFDRMWHRGAACPPPSPPPDWEARHRAASNMPDGQQRNRGNGKAPSSSWPEPVDCFTPLNTNPADVTEDEAPPALWPFIADTAERMGVATSSVTLAAIVTCSAMISDDVRLQPKRYDHTWTENARLWGAIVGPPSTLKTPVISACTRPVNQLEADARRQWQKDMRLYQAQLAEWKKNGGDADDEPEEPKIPRWLVENTTIEALQEVLRDDEGARFTAPAKKVLVRQDELSEFLANLDRYSSGRPGGDRGAYLRLYNGEPFTVDRIGRGSFTASHWSGCLLGGIQPEPIQRIAKQAVDDGLLQRFMYDVPPPQSERGVDRKPDQNALDRYQRLIPALTALHLARSPERPANAVPRVGGLRGVHAILSQQVGARKSAALDRDQVAVDVALHPDAHEHRESIEELARNMAAMPDISTRLQSAFGKWPGLFARLCLTFHLIEVADARACGDIGPPLDVVSASTAERVARYMRRVLLPHLLRADALMFATVQSGHAKWIAGHILAHQLDRITVRDVNRAYLALRPPEARDELQNVMASLVSIGWLDPEPPRNPLNPVSTWRVNPLVHGMFADHAGQERQERRQRQEETIARRQAHAEHTP
jgi:hypothetical protein